MANQENKGKAETFILRGNADVVMRQLVDEYNSSNGWQVNRIVNNILNFTVVLERNSEQGVSKDTSKDNSSDTTKDTTKAETKTTTKAEDVQTDDDTVRVSTEEPTDVEPKPVKATTRKAKTQA